MGTLCHAKQQTAGNRDPSRWPALFTAKSLHHNRFEKTADSHPTAQQVQPSSINSEHQWQSLARRLKLTKLLCVLARISDTCLEHHVPGTP